MPPAANWPPAVSAAGGLGLIGGGYGDPDWLAEQFRAAGNARVCCGFITWSLREKPYLLDQVLAHRPRAIFLSFGDPKPFVDPVKRAGSLVMCQVQTRRNAEHAIGCTFTLVPEVADLIAARSPDTLLCAAGGIADGRGLAAALMLGADGVVVGSRF